MTLDKAPSLAETRNQNPTRYLNFNITQYAKARFFNLFFALQLLSPRSFLTSCITYDIPPDLHLTIAIRVADQQPFRQAMRILQMAVLSVSSFHHAIFSSRYG